MTHGLTPGIRISIAGDSDVATALNTVLRLDGDVTQTSDMAASVFALPDGALGRPVVARQGNEIVGVVWTQRLFPGVYAAWKPYAKDARIRQELYRILGVRLEHPEVRLARCVLSPDDLESVQHFRAIGFEDVATIEMMVWGAEEIATTPWRLGLEPVVDREPSMRDRLLNVMTATYRDSLDCPRLARSLSADEILLGYAHHGSSRSNHWFLASYQSHDVGCLILKRHEDEGQLTLCYVGVVPDHRRNGFGSELVVRAQRLCCQLHCRRLILSVDVDNTPATKSYRKLGFSRYESQLLLART